MDLRKLKLNSKTLFLYLVIAFFNSVFLSSVSYILVFIVQSIVDDNSFYFMIYMLLFVGIAIFLLIFYILEMIFKQKVSYYCEQKFKYHLFDNYKFMTYKQYSKNDIKNKYLYDSQTIISNYYLAKIEAFLFLIKSIPVLVFMALISYEAALISLALNLFSGSMVIILRKKTASIQNAFSKNRQTFIKTSSQSLNGYFDLISFKKRSLLYNLLKKDKNNFFKTQKKIIKRNINIENIFLFFETIVSNGIFILFVLLTNYSFINIVGIFSIISINTILSGYLSSFWSEINDIKSSEKIMKKINNVFSKESSKNIDSLLPLKTQNLKLKTNQKNISYADLSIEKNVKYVIQGKNGVGKSIFLKSILQIYDLESGLVSYNLKDSKNFSDLEISKNYNLITKNPVFVKGNVYENLFISSKEYQDLVKKYQLIFESIGDPLQNIEEKSLGQKQLINLARCLIYKKELLVVDEGLSGIASPLLKRIEKFIFDLQITLIYISHQSTPELKKEIKILNFNDLTKVY